jgi:hypothetical protein
MGAQLVCGLVLRLGIFGRLGALRHPTVKALHGAMQLKAGKRNAYLTP